MLPAVRAGVRFAWESGLRDAARIWTAILVAVTAVYALEASIPVERWASQLAAQPPLRAAAAVSAVAVVAALATAAFLRRILRGPSQTFRDMLPLSRAQRLATDSLSIALFLLVPIATATMFAAFTARHDTVLASGVLLVTFLIPLAAAGLLERLPSDQDSRATRERGGSRELRIRPLTRFTLITNELGWISRAGWRPIVEAEALAILLIGAGSLAVRNNRVESPESALRIFAIFLALAAAALASAALTSWNAGHRWRAHERTLPLPGRSATLLVVAAFVLTPPLLAFGSSWDFGTSRLVLGAAWLSLLFLLFSAGGALFHLDGKNPAFSMGGWGGAAALAGAIELLAAIALAGVLSILLVLHLRRRASRSDTPLAAETEVGR